MNPANAADAWEVEALRALQNGATEYGEYVKQESGRVYRLMRPLKIEESCLKCHADQGYRLGDLRGGISTQVALSSLNDSSEKAFGSHLQILGLLWLAGVAGVVLGGRRIQYFARRLDEERHNLKVLFEAAPVGMVLIGADMSAMRCNLAFRQFFGPDEAIIGQRCGDILQCRQRHQSAAGCNFGSECVNCDLSNAIEAALRKGKKTINGECRIEVAMPEKHCWELSFSVAPTEIEGQVCAICTLTDLAEQKKMARALTSRQTLLEIINHAQRHFIVSEDNHEAFEAILTDILPLTGSEFGFIGEVATRPDNHPLLITHAISGIAWNRASRDFYAENQQTGSEFTNLNSLFGAALQSGEPVIANDPQHDPRAAGLPPGHPPLTSFLGLPIHQDNQLVALVGLANRPGGYQQEQIELLAPLLATIGQLVTAQRSDMEQQKLREQLHQAQKIESIGRLAGGIAHDFNNMLAAILGNAELALRKTAADNPIARHLEQIRETANRSADLTRQLLGFARKQPSNPQVLDLNETTNETLKMVRRLIGEDIELVWKPEAATPLIKIDPTQLNQILMNLAVNARDAMTGTGTLIIGTEGVYLDKDYCRQHPWCVPGTYFCLRVSDTGCGMSQDIRDHIFEPFFTTKNTHEGTGIGLSTVYGIVKQNLGMISVYSEPGEGTTFKVYLPACTEAVSLTATDYQSHRLVAGSETLLFVEDEKNLLELGVAMLEEAGYQVLAAGSPAQALQLVEKQKPQIALLITDMIMPGMSGKDLSLRLREIYPQLKVLFVSGYAADLINHKGLIENNAELLSKPFTSFQLTSRVRNLLES